jgi:ribulose-phosphate 3-epimerase
MKMMQIFPSLISSDILALRDQITLLDHHCVGYHLDVMDGHFVPNISWGPSFINAISQVTTKQLWIHLMVTNPWCVLLQFSIPPGSIVDFHAELPLDHMQLIATLKKQQLCPGVALCPNTPLEVLMPLLETIEQVTVMSVEPGFSGQQFIPTSIKKIAKLAQIRKDHNFKYKIAVDGGINCSNIIDVAQAGAQYVAIANGIFSDSNPVTALQELNTLLQRGM